MCARCNTISVVRRRLNHFTYRLFSPQSDAQVAALKKQIAESAETIKALKAGAAAGGKQTKDKKSKKKAESSSSSESSSSGSSSSDSDSDADLGPLPRSESCCG